MKTRAILFLLVFTSITTLYSQESIIKSFADSTSVKKFCLYASTIRMMNITENQEFYDMVQDIEKILIYDLDSTSIADKSYLNMLSDYKELGFEELAIMEGGETNFYIYSNDKEDKLIGAFKNGESVYAFHINGKIGLQKIPMLIQTISEGDMFNIFDLSPKDAR